MSLLDKFLKFFTARTKARAAGADAKEANVIATVELAEAVDKEQKKAQKQKKTQ